VPASSASELSLDQTADRETTYSPSVPSFPLPNGFCLGELGLGILLSEFVDGGKARSRTVEGVEECYDL